MIGSLGLLTCQLTLTERVCITSLGKERQCRADLPKTSHHPGIWQIWLNTVWVHFMCRMDDRTLYHLVKKEHCCSSRILSVSFLLAVMHISINMMHWLKWNWTFKCVYMPCMAWKVMTGQALDKNCFLNFFQLTMPAFSPYYSLKILSIQDTICV